MSKIAFRPRHPNAANLASLAAWSGLSPADFVPGVAGAVDAEPLAKISVFIHSDPRLSREGAVAQWETMPDKPPDHDSLCHLIDAVAQAKGDLT
jgi:hypothetical protein